MFDEENKEFCDVKTFPEPAFHASSAEPRAKRPRVVSGDEFRDCRSPMLIPEAYQGSMIQGDYSTPSYPYHNTFPTAYTGQYNYPVQGCAYPSFPAYYYTTNCIGPNGVPLQLQGVRHIPPSAYAQVNSQNIEQSSTKPGSYSQHPTLHTSIIHPSLTQPPFASPLYVYDYKLDPVYVAHNHPPTQYPQQHTQNHLSYLQQGQRSQESKGDVGEDSDIAVDRRTTGIVGKISKGRVRWTYDMDKLLEEAVSLFTPLPTHEKSSSLSAPLPPGVWKKVAAYVNQHVRVWLTDDGLEFTGAKGVTNHQCGERYKHHLHPDLRSMKRGEWSEEEMSTLISLVCQYHTPPEQRPSDGKKSKKKCAKETHTVTPSPTPSATPNPFHYKARTEVSSNSGGEGIEGSSEDAAPASSSSSSCLPPPGSLINWQVISSIMNRPYRDCQHRYINYSKCELKRGAYTAQEEALILQRVQEYGLGTGRRGKRWGGIVDIVGEAGNGAVKVSKSTDSANKEDSISNDLYLCDTNGQREGYTYGVTTGSDGGDCSRDVNDNLGEDAGDNAVDATDSVEGVHGGVWMRLEKELGRRSRSIQDKYVRMVKRAKLEKLGW